MWDKTKWKNFARGLWRRPWLLLAGVLGLVLLVVGLVAGVLLKRRLDADAAAAAEAVPAQTEEAPVAPAGTPEAPVPAERK